MSKVISITEFNTLPVPKSNVFGIEVRKYYADGVITITRTLPGRKISEEPVWLQIMDDGNTKKAYTRVISTEICNEKVSKFWMLDDGDEMHEYMSDGCVEIRKRM